MNLSAQVAAAHTQRMLADAVALFPSGAHSIKLGGVPATPLPAPPGNGALTDGAAAAGERYVSALATVRATDDGVNATVAWAIAVGQQGRERAVRVLKSFQIKAAAILPSTNTPEGLRLLASTSQQHLAAMSGVIADTKTANAKLATQLDGYAADYRGVAPRPPGAPAPDTQGDDAVVHESADPRRNGVRLVDHHLPKSPFQPFPEDPVRDPNFPGPHPGDPPYLNGEDPNMIPGAKQIPLTDNPPGFPPVDPGVQRDQNWATYLNGFNPDGSRRVQEGMPPAALPRPEAVQDKGLRAIGAAARQQGVSYAWGANQSVYGPTHGTLAGDPPDGDAHYYRDDERTGFDCGGLVRFSMFQATGQDPFVYTGPPGAGTDLLDTSKYLTPVKGGISGAAVTQLAQPGDVLVFGNPGHEAFSGAGTHHTGIYLGNGVIIDAPQSGLPIRTDPLTGWANEPTDILRPGP